MNGCEINHAFTTVGATLAVLAEATVTRPEGTRPSERTLRHPAPRHDDEALLVWGTLDHIKGNLPRVAHPLDQAVLLVHAVRPDALEGVDGFGDFAQDVLGAVIVLDVGSVDHDFEQVADGVHHDVAFGNPLGAVDPFAGIKAAGCPLGATGFRRFGALTVDNGGTWVRLTLPFGSLLGAVIPP